MDVYDLRGNFNDLTGNLRAGLSLVTGRPVGRETFVYTLDQGLWLLTGLLLLEVFLTYLTTEPPAAYNAHGLNYLGAVYLLDLVVLMAIARVAGAGTREAGELLIVYLASAPFIVAVLHLYGTYEAQMMTQPWLVWAAWLSLLAWQVFIVLRLLSTVLTINRIKATLLASLNTVLLMASLWLLPHMDLWYTDDPIDGEDLYTRLYSLSVEDLFYDQYRMVDSAIDELLPERPGIADLYLVTFGGYGLEKVFLNEVEYVRELFDRQFDTRGRSIVLANNIESLSRYPLANRHNLADTLAGIGRVMEPNEDVLLLFMTSHGSRQHRFSVEFGPVRLDDLTPVQVRQALDDAGIVWRVIIVSSCYSGGFIEPLRSPRTLIITAAAADRQSFGCGAQSEFTDFGTAYFKHALEQNRNFADAFDFAAKWVAEKEQRERREPSRPQRFIGDEILEKLAQIGR